MRDDVSKQQRVQMGRSRAEGSTGKPSPLHADPQTPQPPDLDTLSRCGYPTKKRRRPCRFHIRTDLGYHRCPVHPVVIAS